MGDIEDGRHRARAWCGTRPLESRESHGSVFDVVDYYWRSLWFVSFCF